jgi:hypothetical protein
MGRDPELEEFKTRIDLRVYAASKGFQLDPRESSKASAVMRCGAEKIIIGRDPDDDHYVYFEAHNTHSGSIIDFIQKRERNRVSLGVVRKELRPWVGREARPLPLRPLQKAQRDRENISRAYHRMEIALTHPYLENQRRIPAALLRSPRFAGRIRMDTNGNAVFPHFDAQGLCGYEVKNRTFTGFSPGGSKGLWESHDLEGDNCLVFAEAAIDALSYAVLFPDQKARYRSIGGDVNSEQPRLIVAAIAEMPPGSVIVSAMDADTTGRKLSAMVEKAVADTGRTDLTFRAHLPDSENQDWNDRLCAAKSGPLLFPLP